MPSKARQHAVLLSPNEVDTKERGTSKLRPSYYSNLFFRREHVHLYYEACTRTILTSDVGTEQEGGEAQVDVAVVVILLVKLLVVVVVCLLVFCG